MSASFDSFIGTRQILSSLAIALTLATAACNKSAPSGQTVATVNGEAITQSEVNFEISLTGANTNDRKTLQTKALQALIDRKLVVQAGERDGIDKKPGAVLAVERAKDITISNLALESVVARLSQPITTGDVESYLKKHPELTSERQTLLVEQIRFPAVNDQKLIVALKPAKTMAEIAAVLTEQGVNHQRATLEIDSASMDRKALGRLMSTANGEPLLIIEDSTAIANRVINVRSSETSAFAVTDLAKQGIVRERVQAGIVQHQAALRSAAKIEYAKPADTKSKISR